MAQPVQGLPDCRQRWTLILIMKMHSYTNQLNEYSMSAAVFTFFQVNCSFFSAPSSSLTIFLPSWQHYQLVGSLSQSICCKQQLNLLKCRSSCTPHTLARSARRVPQKMQSLPQGGSWPGWRGGATTCHGVVAVRADKRINDELKSFCCSIS